MRHLFVAGASPCIVEPKPPLITSCPPELSHQYGLELCVRLAASLRIPALLNEYIKGDAMKALLDPWEDGMPNRPIPITRREARTLISKILDLVLYM